MCGARGGNTRGFRGRSRGVRFRRCGGCARPWRHTRFARGHGPRHLVGASFPASGVGAGRGCGVVGCRCGHAGAVSQPVGRAWHLGHLGRRRHGCHRRICTRARRVRGMGDARVGRVWGLWRARAALRIGRAQSIVIGAAIDRCCTQLRGGGHRNLRVVVEPRQLGFFKKVVGVDARELRRTRMVARALGLAADRLGHAGFVGDAPPVGRPVSRRGNGGDVGRAPGSLARPRCAGGGVARGREHGVGRHHWISRARRAARGPAYRAPRTRTATAGVDADWRIAVARCRHAHARGHSLLRGARSPHKPRGRHFLRVVASPSATGANMTHAESPRGTELATTALGQRVPGHGERRWLYRALSVVIRPGEVVAIVGPNGAGKTTLLRALLGLISPTEGRVVLGGRSLEQWSRRDLSRSVAYLTQRPDFPHDMFVERVVGLGRLPHLPWHGSFAASDRQAVREALAATETSHLRHRGMLSLSGGETQRVMLARMLCTRASVLVLDEPTTALDMGHTFSLLEQCRSLADSGKVVILSMHEVDLARRVADRVLCLHGDDCGTCTLGPASDVLVPELVGKVFGVESAVENGVLVFGRGRLRAAD